MSEAIGIMDGAFFVGKSELLHVCTGAVFCQVMDCLYPGSVNMSRVKWNTKQEYDYVHNFKIVQSGFDKNNIEKWLDVEKLIKGRPLDNIEIFQWFYKFFQIRGGNAEGYDGLARRRLAGSDMCDFAKGGYKGKAPAPSKQAVPTATPVAAKPRPTPTVPGATLKKKAPAPAPTPGAAGGSAAEVEALRADNEQLRADLEAQTQWADDIEKERAFYFNKLRKLELLTQDETLTTLDAATVREILYAPYEEEDGVVHEESEVVMA